MPIAAGRHLQPACAHLLLRLQAGLGAAGDLTLGLGGSCIKVSVHCGQGLLWDDEAVEQSYPGRPVAQHWHACCLWVMQLLTWL
jgi:hypothetical protein